MNFIELAKKRYSVRKYKPIPVQERDLSKILEAGRVAPTGANRQPQRLIVVREKEGLEKVKKAANIFDAPLVIIVCGDNDSVWTRKYDEKKIIDIDASIVTDHMMLQATDLGLGSLWICAFKPEVIKEEFNLPSNIVPVNILCIGYEDCEPSSPSRHDTQRKDIKETVCYETFTF